MRPLLWPLAALLLVTPVRAAAPETSLPPAGEPSGTPAANSQEQQLLQRIQELKGEQWRSFGACRYAWARWRLVDNGVRLTELQCGADGALKGTVAVHCEGLRINRKMAEGAWETWRFPLSTAESTSSGGEDRMVAALCANLKPAPAAAPAGSAAPAPAAPKPTP